GIGIAIIRYSVSIGIGQFIVVETTATVTTGIVSIHIDFNQLIWRNLTIMVGVKEIRIGLVNIQYGVVVGIRVQIIWDSIFVRICESNSVIFINNPIPIFVET